MDKAMTDSSLSLLLELTNKEGDTLVKRQQVVEHPIDDGYAILWQIPEEDSCKVGN